MTYKVSSKLTRLLSLYWPVQWTKQARLILAVDNLQALVVYYEEPRENRYTTALGDIRGVIFLMKTR
jgi:hypothetical protein